MLFSYHPSAMGVAYLACMGEGIMLAKAAAGRTKQATLALHLWCQTAASVMALLGFYAIYKNKKNNNAPHFTSTVPRRRPSRLPASGPDRAARARRSTGSSAR